MRTEGICQIADQLPKLFTKRESDVFEELVVIWYKFDVRFEAKLRQVTTVLDLEAEKCYLYLCVAPV